MNGKFRVWDKINKKMHYDNYIKNGHEEYAFHINMGGELWMEWFMFGGSKFEGRSVHDLSKDGNYIQFFATGRQDKNGKDIYGGDICKVFFKMGLKLCPDVEDVIVAIIAPVIFHEGIWMFDDPLCRIKGYTIYSFDSVEIIGNIFENPELLESKE